MSAPENSKPSLRIPPWLRVKLPCNHTFSDTRALVEGLDLHTVCHSAKCPNMFECFSRKTATFLILGNTCTRNCAFCNIGGGIILAPDPGEPARVGKAAAALGLRHAVVTSVTRDDLPDGGSAHFAATIRAIRDSGETCPTIEVLIPDFRGSCEALRTVMDAEPHIINHNVETPPAHYSRIRPQADYQQSLELLRRVKEAGHVSKSGLMVGLGETDEEVHGVLADLAAAGCDIVTIGQYMRPSQKHHPVERYVHPDIFESYAQKGRELGILFGPAGPQQLQRGTSLRVPAQPAATHAVRSGGAARQRTALKGPEQPGAPVAEDFSPPQALFCGHSVSLRGARLFETPTRPHQGALSTRLSPARISWHTSLYASGLPRQSQKEAPCRTLWPSISAAPIAVLPGSRWTRESSPCTAWASAKRRNSRTRAHSSAPAERPWIGIPAPPTRSSSAWLAPSPIR